MTLDEYRKTRPHIWKIVRTESTEPVTQELPGGTRVTKLSVISSESECQSCGARTVTDAHGTRALWEPVRFEWECPIWAAIEVLSD